MRCGFCISFNLKSFSVSPMYVSVVLLSLRVTVAQQAYLDPKAYLDPQRQQHRTLYFLAHSLIALAVQQLKQKVTSATKKNSLSSADLNYQH